MSLCARVLLGTLYPQDFSINSIDIHQIGKTFFLKHTFLRYICLINIGSVEEQSIICRTQGNSSYTAQISRWGEIFSFNPIATFKPYTSCTVTPILVCDMSLGRKMYAYSSLIVPTKIPNHIRIILLKLWDYQYFLTYSLFFLCASRKAINMAFLKSICCGLYPAFTNPPKTPAISIKFARDDVNFHLGWIMKFDPLHL